MLGPATRLSLASLLALFTLALAGCPEGGNPRRDTGGGAIDAPEPADDTPGVLPDVPTTPECGDVGQECCGAAGTCSPGRRCESDACCAVPGSGVACEEPTDCCGGADCVGGGCCALQGSACRSSTECCSDLLCEGGTCVLPEEDCGRDGGPCCDGDVCRSGSVCASGRCETCGADGEICCPAPDECAAGLTCDGGTCGTPVAGCGNAGEECCAGERCNGELACEDGTCTMPATECAYLDCGECTNHYPCGWCGGTGTCGVGTADGPESGSCADWSWLTSECTGPTDPCADAADCDACTARAGCGFCDGECQSGDASGPTGGSCSGDWAWISSECEGPVDTCASNTDCASCTGAPSCGWCAGTGTCSSGTSAGPTGGSCAAWSWLSSSCPVIDACSDSSTCIECTDRSGCGYCASSGECVSGDLEGPNVGSCADWDYTSTQCMCAPPAAACTSDSMCCGDLSCRRGITFGVRCCTESGDSCGTSADCCGYMDCRSGTCACRAAGRGCLDGRDCCSGTCTAGRCG